MTNILFASGTYLRLLDSSFIARSYWEQYEEGIVIDMRDFL